MSVTSVSMCPMQNPSLCVGYKCIDVFANMYHSPARTLSLLVGVLLLLLGTLLGLEEGSRPNKATGSDVPLGGKLGHVPSLDDVTEALGAKVGAVPGAQPAHLQTLLVRRIVTDESIATAEFIIHHICHKLADAIGILEAVHNGRDEPLLGIAGE